MRLRLPITREKAFRTPIPLLAKMPAHPSAPLDGPSAVARKCGQGRPSAGAGAMPLTAMSTMAGWRYSGGGTGSHLALLVLAVALSIAIPGVVTSARTEAAEQRSDSNPYGAHIAEAARRFDIPPAWIRAVMRVESDGDRRAVSPKGAMGLMQLMPETWADMRARHRLGSDPFDPRDNILAGTAYLREMHDRYGFPGFLAAYNAGPGRYEDYRDRQRRLPAETIAYVAAIAPFVDGAAIAGSVWAASSRSPWTLAPLFAVPANDTATADPAPPERPARQTAAAISVRDVSAIVPQSNGLFVALSRPGAAR